VGQRDHHGARQHDLNEVTLLNRAVTVTFPDDSWTGDLAVVEAHGCPPPEGFEFVPETNGQGHCWQIVAEPPISGMSMQICSTYDQSWFGAESAMEQFILISHTTGNVVCSQVDSFSPFALVVPAGPVFTSPPGTAGVAVSYPQPAATDRRDGSRLVMCDHAPGAKFGPGKTVVSCSAADSDGHVTTASFTVWVQCQAPADGTFFLPPINSDGTSTFKGGTIPVKFRLSGASAPIGDLTALRLPLRRVGAPVHLQPVGEVAGVRHVPAARRPGRRRHPRGEALAAVEVISLRQA
jgi:hypothetical protein